ncbi:MAG: YbaN family protein [Limisphaerales bacterium]
MPDPQRRSHPVFRGLWIFAGLVACGLGFLGILLPGMPATVFFIAAAACFTRGSDRLLHWVLNLPRVGSLVRDYRLGLGMPRSAKVWASVTMAVCVGFSIAKFPEVWQGLLVGLLAGCGALYIWFRVPTRASFEPASDPVSASNSNSTSPSSSPSPSPHPLPGGSSTTRTEQDIARHDPSWRNS